MISKKRFYSSVMLGACIFSTHFVEASPGPTVRIVSSISNDPNTVGTLPYWLLNANSGDTIDCGLIARRQITLNSSLPAITKSYIINGAGITIDGAGDYQAFQVASGSVVINNINIKNAISKGGDGGSGYSGGGGGVGGGGALYIHGGTSVTLTACGLINNTAQGGDGGSADFNGNGGAGGGGGFAGGNGGSCLTTVSTGGGAGGHSNGGNGGSQSSKDGGNGVYYGGGGGGAGINSVGPGGIGGNATPSATFIGGAESQGNGGGGAGDSQNGFSATGGGGIGIPGNGGSGIGIDFLFGGGGGGGTSSETGFSGGAGVGAAGGGGGYNYSGGTGGILGGGGGGGVGTVGGAGGFGAGGGGAKTGGLGGGGFGAGGGKGASDPGGNSAGGGGSGVGGAVFVQSGGNLTVIDSLQISGNRVFAGVAGSSTSTDPNYIPAEDGSKMGYDIFLREQGSVTFDMNSNLTITTPIEGDQTNSPNTIGGLFKMGKGTLKLNGANTYSGVTNVVEGTLNLNGSVIGNAVVGVAGTLSGNSAIFGNLTNSGILSPGNSIGFINTTNLVLTPSSILEMEVSSSGTNDLITATGTAQINGTLEVIPLPGIFESVQSYTLINAAGGRSGTFSAIQTNIPSLLQVIYEPTTVIVDILPLSSLKLSRNAAAAATCYLTNGFVPDSDIEIVNSALLTLDADEINHSFNQMQPSQYSGLGWGQIQNALFVRSSYSQHLEEVNLLFNCCNSPQVWGEAIGAWQKQNSHRDQFGFTDWTGGTTIGLDAVCCNEFRFGIAASYTYSRLNWNRSAGHANIRSYYGGAYANWSSGLSYVTATLIGAYSHYQTHRHIHFATIDRHAKSSHNSWQLLGGLEAGVVFGCNECSEIVPFARVDYIHLSQQGFLESGANSLDLNVDRHQDQIVQSECGIFWTGQYVYADSFSTGTFMPLIKLSYIHDSSFRKRHFHANFADSNCAFSVRGLSFYRNQGAVSLGLTYLNCEDTLSVTLRYDGQFSENYYNQAANLAIDVKF